MRDSNALHYRERRALRQVRDHGAELRSIKEREDETEYLWNGDPTW